MKSSQVIQGFSGREAILALGQSRSRDTLAATLVRLGLKVVDCPVEDWISGQSQAAIDPDHQIAFIDLDLAYPRAQDHDGFLGSCPTVALIGSEVPSRLRLMFELGATASLAKPVYGGSVYSALFLAVNEFNLRASLTNQIRIHEERRRKRPQLISAIIRAMSEFGQDEHGAFLHLRRESMRNRQSIEDYALQYLESPRTPHQSLLKVTGTIAGPTAVQGPLTGHEQPITRPAADACDPIYLQRPARR